MILKIKSAALEGRCKKNQEKDGFIRGGDACSGEREGPKGERKENKKY